VTSPGDVQGLTAAIRQAASADDIDQKRERAAEVSRQFSMEAAMTRYGILVQGLLRASKAIESR
jgi:hypothetical protein